MVGSGALILVSTVLLLMASLRQYLRDDRGRVWVSPFGVIVLVLDDIFVQRTVDDSSTLFCVFATAIVDKSSTLAPQNLREVHNTWHITLLHLAQPAP